MANINAPSASKPLTNSRLKSSLTLVLGVWIIAVPVGAADNPMAKRDVFNVSTTSSLVPNELNPIDAAAIYQAAPRGVMISVGTERTHFGYLLAPKITKLYQTDQSSPVTLYNSINDFMLGALPRLLAKNELSGIDTVEKLKQMAGDSIDIPFTQAEWEYFRNLRLSGMMSRFMDGPSEFNGFAFSGVNYLHDPSELERLHRSAIEKRLVPYQIDLSNRDQLAEFVKILRGRGEDLSLVDLSNAWNDQYMGPNGLRTLFEEFAAVGTGKTVFVFTQSWSGNGKLRPDLDAYINEQIASKNDPKFFDASRPNGGDWVFFGLTADGIRELESTYGARWSDLLGGLESLDHNFTFAPIHGKIDGFRAGKGIWALHENPALFRWLLRPEAYPLRPAAENEKAWLSALELTGRGQHFKALVKELSEEKESFLPLFQKAMGHLSLSAFSPSAADYFLAQMKTFDPKLAGLVSEAIPEVLNRLCADPRFKSLPGPGYFTMRLMEIPELVPGEKGMRLFGNFLAALPNDEAAMIAANPLVILKSPTWAKHPFRDQAMKALARHPAITLLAVNGHLDYLQEFDHLGDELKAAIAEKDHAARQSVSECAKKLDLGP